MKENERSPPALTLEDNQSKCDNDLDNFHVNGLQRNEPKISPNNNSCLDISESIASINISNSNTKRPNHLFTKLGFGSIDFEKCDIFSIIEKPSKKELFAEYHSRLHAEARLALAQV